MADRKPKSPTATAQAPARRAAERKRTPLRVSYQGEPGANSHLACREVLPDFEPLACATFEDALAAVKGGDARYAMIPIENSVAGRVADIHHLLPNAGLQTKRIFKRLLISVRGFLVAGPSMVVGFVSPQPAILWWHWQATKWSRACFAVD